MFSVLLTAAAILLFAGIRWLSFLGLSLAMLSILFSKRLRASARRPIQASILYFGAAVFFFIEDYQDGEVFSRQTPEPVFLIIFAAAWMWGIVSEWQAIRRLQNDA